MTVTNELHRVQVHSLGTDADDPRTKLEAWEQPSVNHVATPEPSRLARDLRDAIFDIDRRDPSALEAHAEFLALAAEALRHARERRERRLGRA